jgi:hypothetical protein
VENLKGRCCNLSEKYVDDKFVEAKAAVIQFSFAGLKDKRALYIIWRFSGGFNRR